MDFLESEVPENSWDTDRFIDWICRAILLIR